MSLLQFIYQRLEVGQLAVREILDFEAVLLQRVGGDVHAHVLFLFLQQVQGVLLSGEGRHLRTLRSEFLGVAEQRGGCVEFVGRVHTRIAYQFVDEQVSVGARLEILRALVAE